MTTNATPTENNLIRIVSDEITCTTIDLGIDYLELPLDDFLVDGVLREIPMIKTIYAVGKLGLSIRERYFVKKLFVFLSEFYFQKGNVITKELSKIRIKFDTDKKYREKVTEHLIIHIDSFLNAEKSKIFAKLFRAYLEGCFNWEHFTHLSSCLNSINPKGFSYLEKLSHFDFQIPEENNNDALKRDGESESILYSCGIAYETSCWSSGFNISQLGKDLFNYGIKGNSR